MKKDIFANLVFSIIAGLIVASIVGGTIHNIYVQRKVLNIMEQQEFRRTDFSEAKFVLGVIDDVFQNKYN